MRNIQDMWPRQTGPETIGPLLVKMYGPPPNCKRFEVGKGEPAPSVPP